MQKNGLRQLHGFVRDAVPLPYSWSNPSTSVRVATPLYRDLDCLREVIALFRSKFVLASQSWRAVKFDKLAFETEWKLSILSQSGIFSRA